VLELALVLALIVLVAETAVWLISTPLLAGIEDVCVFLRLLVRDMVETTVLGDGG
jgi:hypothetical protein